MAEFTHRNVGEHAYEVNVGDKRVMVERGGFVTLGTLDTADPNNKALIEGGILFDMNTKSPEVVPVVPAPPTPATPTATPTTADTTVEGN